MIKPEVYIVIRNHENNGETVVFRGEIVETNLIEVGEKVAKYRSDEMLPNWINLMLEKTGKI